MKINDACEYLVATMFQLNIERLKEKRTEIMEYAQENNRSPELIEFLDWAFDRVMEIKQEEQREAVGKGGTV